MSTRIKSEYEWEAEGLGLAGRQLVESGETQLGDLRVGSDGIRWRITSNPGDPIPDQFIRTYRKIPIPKQGDLGKRNEALDNLATQAQELDMGYGKAKTYDDGKPPLAQLPWAALRELSMVQLYGHKKYKDFNNYRKGMEITRNLSCAIRHISEFIDGHDTDAESGRSHLGHAMCRIAFVLQNLADGVAIDDRYKNQSK